MGGAGVQEAGCLVMAKAGADSPSAAKVGAMACSQAPAAAGSETAAAEAGSPAAAEGKHTRSL